MMVMRHAEPLRGPPTGHLIPAGLVRRLGIDANPLRRGLDRIETLVILAALVVAALAIPVAAAAGTNAQAGAATEAARQRAESRSVPARTLDDAVAPLRAGPIASLVSVSVAWVDDAGEPQQGTVAIERGTKAGSEVSIWVDARGRQVHPPASQSDTTAVGVSTAIGVLMAAWATLGVIVLGARRWLDRCRLRTWEIDWRRIAPLWTGYGSQD
jgi:hypothetical protein